MTMSPAWNSSYVRTVRMYIQGAWWLQPVFTLCCCPIRIEAMEEDRSNDLGNAPSRPFHPLDNVETVLAELVPYLVP